MRKHLLHILIIIPLVIFSSCDLEDNDVIPTNRFTKIYDNNRFDSSITPIDVAQTADGGYIIVNSRRLENTDFLGINVMKVDELGNFVSQTDLADNFVQPIADLMLIGGNFYFLCMDATSLVVHLVAIDDSGAVTDPAAVSGGLFYPLHATIDGTNILLQSYNNDNKETDISIIGTDGSISASQSFTIGSGQGVEEPIIEHFTRTGKSLPFMVGRTTGGTYFFNGFYNFTLSMVFTDLSSGDPNGVLQGQQDDGGLSSALHLSGNTFAVSRFNFGDNYIVPQASIDMGGTTSSVDLSGNQLPELPPDTKVDLLLTEVNSQQVLIYGSNTNSKQILLLAYDASAGDLLGTQRLGFSNPYEISNMTPTADGGLVVVGTTFVAGRFARVVLFKLDESDLVALTSQ